MSAYQNEIEARCAREIEERLARLTWCLQQIITDLPQRRDWLDPAVEMEARHLLEAK